MDVMDTRLSICNGIVCMDVGMLMKSLSALLNIDTMSKIILVDTEVFYIRYTQHLVFVKIEILNQEPEM